MTLFKYSPPDSDRATTYFAPWFIRDPKGPILAGWEFDLAASTACSPQHEPEIHRPECFQGVLVKSTYTQEVWRLTGNVDDRGYFEGRWPD